jgi:hypothetical protein
MQSVSRKFEADGFATVDNLADTETVSQLKKIYDAMIDGSIPCPGTDRLLGGLTRQIMMPHVHHAYMADNPAFHRGREIAKDLVQSDNPECRFSMLIYKPAGHEHETPWHSDVSYSGRPFAPAGTAYPNHVFCQFWVALDDVDEDMGCMEFASGRHKEPMLPHYVASGDDDDLGRLLAIQDPDKHLDLSGTVKCPLKAGSATVHGYNTPHYTGPNRGKRGRPAYIFNFANPELARSLGLPESSSAKMAN